MSGKFYEVEGAVFRKRSGMPMEVMDQKTGRFESYKGDSLRVLEKCHPMTVDEVRPYMDVAPVLDEDEDSAVQKH